MCFGGQHGQSPRFLAERGNGQQRPFFDESNGSFRFLGHERRLRAGGDMKSFDFRQGGRDVIPKAHFRRRLAHFDFAPCQFPLAHGNQLVRRLRYPLRGNLLSDRWGAGWFP